MKSLLDLFDDIIFQIFRYILFSSGVEGLIRLETVCKRMREICLSRRCWIDALETLENRPPFTTSRSFLLELSAADLRKEVTRAAKLDRSWKAEGGPPITQEINIPYQNRRYEQILPLPEVDLVFASYYGSGMNCWSISQKTLIWEHHVPPANEMSISPGSNWTMVFDCDVAHDYGTVLVGLVCSNSQEQSWYVQVYQLDARTFDCELLFESPPMSVIIYGYILIKYLHIRGHYIAFQTYKYDISQPTLIFMDWKENLFFRIIKLNEPNTRISLLTALTQDDIFFICEEDDDISTSYRLVGIRYRDLFDNSASISEHCTTFEFVDLKDRGVYSDMILEYEQSPTDDFMSTSHSDSVAAVVTTWKRTPATRITALINEMAMSKESSRISIFDIAFTLNGSGHGSFKVIHLYSKVLMPMTFFSTPSVAMRAVIQPLETLRATTFAITINEDNEGIVKTETIHPLFHQSQASNAGGIDLWIRRSDMDPLGRMFAYFDSSKQSISIIRFD